MLDSLNLLLSQIEDLLEQTQDKDHHGLHIHLLTFRRTLKIFIRKEKRNRVR